MVEAAQTKPPITLLQNFFTRKLPFWYAFVLVLIADLGSKAWAENTVRPIDPGKIDVIPGFLAWKWAENLGAAFSIFSGNTGMLALIALGVTSAIFIFMIRSHPDRKWFLLGLGLVAGGALGNLHDRVLLGHVRDFILFDFDMPGYTWSITWFWRDTPSRPIPQRFPIFNVADMAIDGGVGVMLLLSLFTKDAKPKPAEAR